jgi:hypothetical protein
MLGKSIHGSAKVIIEPLIKSWLDDTKWESSISFITNHDSFERLKQIGYPAGGYILKEMETGSIFLHWFPLLQDIFEIDPVEPGHRGFLPDMASDWVRWGRQTGKLL